MPSGVREAQPFGPPSVGWRVSPRPVPLLPPAPRSWSGGIPEAPRLYVGSQGRIAPTARSFYRRLSWKNREHTCRLSSVEHLHWSLGWYDTARGRWFSASGRNSDRRNGEGRKWWCTGFRVPRQTEVDASHEYRGGWFHALRSQNAGGVRSRRFRAHRKFCTEQSPPTPGEGGCARTPDRIRRYRRWLGWGRHCSQTRWATFDEVPNNRKKDETPMSRGLVAILVLQRRTRICS